MSELIPPTPPEKDNFGALPIFKEIALEKSSLGEKNRQKLRQASLLPPEEERQGRTRPKRNPNNENYLIEYAVFLGLETENRSSFEIAKNLLTIIEQKAGETLQELQASAILSQAQLPENPFQNTEEKLWFNTPLPHFIPLLEIAKTNHLKGIAAVEIADRESAREALALSLPLRDLLKNDLLIGLLAAHAVTELSLDLIQYGMKKQIWSNQDLIYFMESFQAPPLREAMLSNFQKETISALQIAALSKTNHETNIVLENFPAMPKFFPKGWYDQDKARILDIFLPFIPLNSSATDSTAFLSAIQTFEEKATSSETSLFPPPIYSAQLESLILDIIDKIITGDLRRGLMLTSCAIEQFHLTHNRLPDQLSDLDLIPQYQPEESTHQSPLRYQTQGTNSYILYTNRTEQKNHQEKLGENANNPTKSTGVTWKVTK